MVNRIKSGWRAPIVFLLSACLVGVSSSSLNAIRFEGRGQERDALYLPRVDALTWVSLDYRHALAHLLWFKTMSYFGREFRGEKNYQWLGHMCDLVTTLNPHLPPLYRFCATMLSWEVSDYQRSNAILSRAMEHRPQDWIFPYLRGFNHLYFLKDVEAAQKDFLKAAQLPGVHPVVASLAAKKTMNLQDPNLARLTIRGLVQLTDDPLVREALEKRLQELEEKE